MAHSNVQVDGQKFQHAKLLLEGRGFTVSVAPSELWEYRCVLTAYNSTTGEGYLVGPEELNMICHYGVDYLNPHEFTEPRYKAKDNSNRIKHYAEAAIARAYSEVALAAPGTSNASLNKAAFAIGRFAFGWGLDPDSLQAQLLEVATHRGVSEREARAVIGAGVKAGAKNFKSPDDLLDEVVGKPKTDSVASKHLAKLSRRLAH